MLNKPWYKRIRYERLKRAWSQVEAAEHLGVDERVLRDWEAGRHVPIGKHRQRLSLLYGQSVEKLGLVNPKPIR
jgi:ribosome-binding protein aMBF1 (putative translation factor)